MTMLRSTFLITLLSLCITMSTHAEDKGSVLRHVVCFKFKAEVTPAKIKEIEDAFKGLKTKIPQISAFEWGTNNSPENLAKGFTHCFTLSFKSEDDRKTYLPHPDHKAFGALLKGSIDDVFVIDYWAKE
jgi:hypothetical protein